jgi:hypothetical protein
LKNFLTNSELGVNWELMMMQVMMWATMLMQMMMQTMGDGGVRDRA